MRILLKTLVAAVITTASLSGCGKWDRAVATATGYSRICVDGVSYLQFTSGASVEYQLDGKPKACK